MDFYARGAGSIATSTKYHVTSSKLYENTFLIIRRHHWQTVYENIVK